MTAETTRIWMYENRERWNEYQRNYYRRKKGKVHEYRRNCLAISVEERSEETTPGTRTDVPPLTTGEKH